MAKKRKPVSFKKIEESTTNVGKDPALTVKPEKVEEVKEFKPVDLGDRTPEQALKDDWPRLHRQLAPYITEKGTVRGGLKPSQVEKAKKILKMRGFTV